MEELRVWQFSLHVLHLNLLNIQTVLRAEQRWREINDDLNEYLIAATKVGFSQPVLGMEVTLCIHIH